MGKSKKSDVAGLSLVADKPKKKAKKKSSSNPSNPSNKLLKYLRGEHGKRIGFLLGVKRDNCVHVYWSLCRKGDTFSLGEGCYQALIRPEVRIPSSVSKELERFVERCHSYFKTTELIVH